MTKYDAHDRAIVIIASIFVPLSFLSVVLRFQARRVTKAQFGWDDFFAVVSFLFYCAWTGFAIYAAQHGGGYELKKLPIPVLEHFLKIATISTLMIPYCMAAAKASILCFYNRIFSADPTFSRWVKIVMVLNVMWCIATTFAVIFQCLPPDGAWIVTRKARCFDYAKLTIAIEVPNAFFDFVIMALPINVLRTLRMRLRYKISLAAIFFLGAFVGIVGFVRIGVLYRPNDSAFNLSASGQWVTVQQGFAVICCCLPTFQPLFGKFDSLIKRYASMLSKILTNSSNHSKPIRHNGGAFHRVGTSSERERWVPSRSKVAIEHEQQIKPIEYPMDSINIEGSVYIV